VNDLRSEPRDVGAQNVLGLVAWGVGSIVTGLVARARTILDWIIAFLLLTGAQTLFVLFGPLVISVMTLGHGA